MINPRKSVLNMAPYNPPLEGRRSFMRLDFNENTEGCSPAVLKALRSVTADEIAAYPEYRPLYESLSSYFDLPPEMIQISNGSDESIMSTFQIFGESGSKVLIPFPTFSMFRFYAELLALNIIPADYEERFVFPYETYSRLLKEEKPDIAVFVSPSVPSGSLIESEYIKKTAQENPETLFLLDEAYYQFSGVDNIRLAKETDNIIILRTFSKAFGLGGLRFGVIFGQERIINFYRKAASPYSVNTITAKAVPAALNDRQSIERYIKDVIQNRGKAVLELRKKNIKVFPSASNFILMSLEDRAVYTSELLRKKGILVRPQKGHPLIEGCLRATIGTKKQTRTLIEELLKITGEE
ncbi:MAG: pyridoxal phosphate-dependent aminotransferase [Fibrobacterota bacterium]